jgi:rod shape-determining protein MreC
VAVISSQLNKHQRRLFVADKQTLPALIFSIMLAISTMVMDYRYHYLDSIRYYASYLVYPLQKLVDYPFSVAEWVQALVTAKTDLIQENMRLRYQQTLLDAKLQKMMALQEENQQLKALLASAHQNEGLAVAASIMAVYTNTTRQIFITNKGKRDGIAVGWPVIDAKGVVGQVIDVGYATSTVLMISDAKSAISVVNNKTGQRAILVGKNDISQLLLLNLPQTAAISPGDLLVTSGLGGRYPSGLPVGKVEQVVEMPGEGFYQVSVKPMANLNRDRLVLIISPSEEQELINEQIKNRLDRSKRQEDQ